MLAFNAEHPILCRFTVRVLYDGRQLRDDGNAKIGQRRQLWPTLCAHADYLCMIFVRQDNPLLINQQHMASGGCFLSRQGSVKRFQADISANHRVSLGCTVGDGGADFLGRIKKVGRCFDLPCGGHCRFVPVARARVVRSRIIRVFVDAQGGKG